MAEPSRRPRAHPHRRARIRRHLSAHHLLLRLAASTLLLAACSGDDTTSPTTTVVLTTTTSTSTSTSTTTTSTTTSTTTTTTTTTTPPTTGPGVEVGRSVEGRPILAEERGTAGGTPVLVIGVIHGDEQAGVAVVDRLSTTPVPPGVDLWLVTSMNPDGEAVPQRGNARGVDLNRNFPDGWGPIGGPGDGQYAGSGPASEPETRAIVGLVDQIHPQLTIFYHQDLNRLSPSSGLEGRLKERYAELTGLPIERITGGTYTGVAATWIRHTTGDPAFIVELGPTLSGEQADTHAAAVLDVASMVAG